MIDPLFAPIRIGGLELANRITMPAMHLNMTTSYEVSQRILDFYAERAAGGVGLITVGYATVDERSGNRTCLGAHDDRFVPGLRRLAETIQAGGARAAVQLNHAGRYAPSMLMKKGVQPVAPSAVASRLTRETPRALSVEELREIIEAFAAAAKRVQEAGFDAVEVLAGTGYLISQFLSPLTNQRDDEYGGELEARMRFGREVVQAVRAAVGPAFPIVVRTNGNDFMPGGLGRETLKRFAVALVEAGTDALCVNVGWHEGRVPQITSGVPAGVFGYLARGIKEAVDVPVIASHRINDPDLARELILSRACDLVAMGRALIADPELPSKAREGREDEVLHCLACGQGCLDQVFRLRPVQCLCNPRAGHEGDAPPEPADEPRQVMVVGGGPAGLSAATAAAQRGHEVTLYEAGERLGGQLRLAGTPPGREAFDTLADELVGQARRAGVRFVLGKRVDGALLDAERPDELVLAAGARPVRPEVPGIDGPQVAQAWDVLSRTVQLGRRVVVVGGGATGVETALDIAERGTLSPEALRFLLLHQAEPLDDLRRLATRGAHEVTVVEQISKIGKDIGRSTRWTLLQDLEHFGVATRTKTKLVRIAPGAVVVEGPEGEEELGADSVVLALGAKPDATLKEAAEERGISVRVVGDARKVGDALAAVHAGFKAGVGV